MDNSFEKQALDAIDKAEALKAQVNALRKCLVSESQGGIVKRMGFIDGRIKWYDKVAAVIAMTPEQCLNSVRADAIDEMCDKMPSSGFTKIRDQRNWIGDYIDNLKTNNG